MIPKEILEASFAEVIKDSLLSDSSFYAQMSLKSNDDKQKQQEQVDLSQKYYDALEWFDLLITQNKNLKLIKKYNQKTPNNR